MYPFKFTKGCDVQETMFHNIPGYIAVIKFSDLFKDPNLGESLSARIKFALYMTFDVDEITLNEFTQSIEFSFLVTDFDKAPNVPNERTFITPEWAGIFHIIVLTIPSLLVILICANVTTNRLKTFRGLPHVDLFWNEIKSKDITGAQPKKN
jgi:hypothetical protein